MLPKAAVIKSGTGIRISRKLFGQYPLERNIRLLWQAGFTTIQLLLNDEEEQLFNKKISRKIGRINTTIVMDKAVPSVSHLAIDSNQFFLYSAFSHPEDCFTQIGSVWQIKNSEEQFMLNNPEDFKRASRLSVTQIRLSAGGWIARNINKRISIPISLLLVKTGIHPNVITFINFFIGMSGAALLFSNEYHKIAAAGILIQGASIFDGCDGEVAKMSTKFSKLGGTLDSLSDHSLAIAIISGTIYQMYQNVSTPLATTAAALMLIGVTLAMGSVLYYVARYSESRSFVAYNREFLDHIPKTDLMMRIIDTCKYLLSKEYYSVACLIFCLAGIVHYYAVFMSIALISGGILLLITNFRFIPVMDSFRKEGAMMYISGRK